KVPGGIDLTRSPVGWRYGSGPYRKRGSALHGLLLTQRTVGLVRQTCAWFGLTGAVALGLDGISWPLGQPTGWGRPEVGQHDAQPHQDQDHQLIVEEVWYHGMPPYMGGKGDHFIWFLSDRNYPQVWGTRPSSGGKGLRGVKFVSRVADRVIEANFCRVGHQATWSTKELISVEGVGGESGRLPRVASGRASAARWLGGCRCGAGGDAPPRGRPQRGEWHDN